MFSKTFVLYYHHYLSHSLLPKWDIIRPERHSGDDLLGIALHDHPVVYHLVHGEHDHLHVVTQGLLVHVLPQDTGDRVEQTIKNCHQQQLIFLTYMMILSFHKN